MLLMAEIANTIGKRYAKFAVLKNKIIEDVSELCKAFAEDADYLEMEQIFAHRTAKAWTMS